MKHALRLAALVLLFTGCKYIDSPDIQLNASVHQTAYGIAVTNGGTGDYTDVSVKINYGLTGAYEAHVSRIAKGERVVIPYGDFTNSSNERFDNRRTKPETVMVTASMNGGRDWQEFK